MTKYYYSLYTIDQYRSIALQLTQINHKDWAKSNISQQNITNSLWRYLLL